MAVEKKAAPLAPKKAYRPPVVRTEPVAVPNLFSCTPGFTYMCNGECIPIDQECL